MDDKKMCKRITYVFFSVILPLFIGFFFYVFFKPDTYISGFVREFVLLPAHSATGIFTKCFYNWGCDFLWAYAMNSLLVVLLSIYRKPALIAALLTGVTGICLEIFQLFWVFDGTFDFIDIISEVLAIIISDLIIKKFEVV